MAKRLAKVVQWFQGGMKARQKLHGRPETPTLPRTPRKRLPIQLRMDIPNPNNPNPNVTIKYYGFADTGNSVSCLVRNDVAQEFQDRGVHLWPHCIEVRGLGPRTSTFWTEGYILLTWKYKDKDYMTKFHKLPANIEANFDFLLDQQWINESEYFVHPNEDRVQVQMLTLVSGASQ